MNFVPFEFVRIEKVLSKVFMKKGKGYLKSGLL